MSEILKEATRLTVLRHARKYANQMATPNVLTSLLLSKDPEKLREYEEDCKAIKSVVDSATDEQLLEVMKHEKPPIR